MEKNRISVYVPEEILRECDNSLEYFDVRNRSELVTLALKRLFGIKTMDVYEGIITPAISNAINGSVQLTEQRITNILFKLAVEIDMMMHVIAATNEIDEESLEMLREMCLKEVKRTHGRIDFGDAVRFQNDD